MLWPLLQVLQLQKKSFGAFFSGLQSVHGQNTWPCILAMLHCLTWTRPCIMAVFSTASKFWKVNFELLLCFSHTRCILDNILTYYAWINHLDHLQMLYLIKWLNGLLIDEICNSYILNEYACHSCKVDHGLVYILICNND